MLRTLRWARARVAEGATSPERGASLILALAFLTLFGVAIAALLSFAQTAFMANTSVHKQGESQYATAGAIDTEIQRLRNDVTQGVDGGACASLALAQAATSATASCVPQPGSGKDPPGGYDRSLSQRPPLNAILTMGGGITTTSGAAIKADGPIFANGPINLGANGELDAVAQADWPVTATGACSINSNWKFVAPILECDTGTDVTGGGSANPAYPSRRALENVDLGTPIRFRSPNDPLKGVKCTGQGGGSQTIGYPAGYYTDATLLTRTCGNGPNGQPIARVFEPGVFYFDFGAGCRPSSNAARCTTKQWTIDDGVPIVGGTLAGTLAAKPSFPDTASPAAAPLACKYGPGVAGVQFIFGGSSTMALGPSAQMELCGGTATAANPDAGRIVMYGQGAAGAQLGAGISLALAPSPECNQQLSNSPCWRNRDAAGFDASRAVAVDGQAIEAYIKVPQGGNSTSSASFTYGVAPPSVPQSWGGNEVEVAIQHVETGQGGTVSTGKASVQIDTCTFDLNDASIDPSFKSTKGTLSTVTFSSLDDTLSQAEQTCLLNLSTKPNLVYTASVGKNTGQDAGTAFLAGVDGITVTFRSRLRSQTGNPFFTAAPCARIAVWGTIYMPDADFNVDASPCAGVVSNKIVSRGAIMRSLTITGGNLSAPVFRLGTGRREVQLTGTPSSGGVAKAVALVRITDYTRPGYWSRITRWSVQR